jgi:hypothetical protein
VKNNVNQINPVRLIINKAYTIDNIAYIFHPVVGGGPKAFLDGNRVE